MKCANEIPGMRTPSPGRAGGRRPSQSWRACIEELLSILVYGHPESGGLPADCSLVDSVDEFHVGHDIRQVTKPA